MSIALLEGLFEALPETDAELCDDALDRGDMLRASFYCPAGTFLGSLFGPGDDEEEGDDDEEDE